MISGESLGYVDCSPLILAAFGSQISLI